MAADVLSPALAEDLKQRCENAPFNHKLGIQGVAFERGRAVLKLGFASKNTTVGDIIHGGAIAALVDCAATAAAWTTINNPENYHGITVDLTLNYAASGRSSALQADARIIKQGRFITYLECTVTNASDEIVSKSLVTY